MHVHPEQDSSAEVLSGSLLFVVSGRQVRVPAGSRVDIPRNTPHTFRNESPEEVYAIQEFRPALRIAEFFETLFALAQRGELSPHGMPSPLPAALSVPAFRREIRLASPPWLVQRLRLAPLAPCPGCAGCSRPIGGALRADRRPEGCSPLAGRGAGPAHPRRHVSMPQIVGFEHMDAIAVLVITKVRGRRISPQDRGVWRELGAIVAQVSAIEPPRGSWGRRWPELVIKRTCEELEQWVALCLIGREDEPALIDRIRGLEPILALRPLSADTHNDLQADHVLIDPATGKVQDLLG